MIKLTELNVGEKAIIKSIEHSDYYLKLLEMGCLPGEKICITQIAPFGDPISIQIAGYQLSLRLVEAQHVIVSLV